MISLLIAFVSFIVTLPLKLFQMGTEITLKAREKTHQLEKNDGVEEENLGARLKLAGNRIKKVGETGRNIANTTNKAGNKAAQLAIKTLKMTIRLLKMVIVLLRSISIIFASIGTVLIVIVILVLIVLIVAASYIAFAYGDNVDNGGLFSKEKKEGIVEYDSANGTTPLTTEAPGQIFGDNSSWRMSCKSMFDWYFVTIDTYQCAYPPAKGTGKRKGYVCPLFDNRVSVGDDCSAFVTACLAYAGFISETTANANNAWNSSKYADPTNADLAKYFNHYTPEDYLKGKYIPRAGDILAYKGHVEIIASVPTDSIEPGNCASWSWGTVPKSNPVPRATDVSTYLKQMWVGNTHKVTDIWTLKDGVDVLYGTEVTNYKGVAGTNKSNGIEKKPDKFSKTYVDKNGKTKTYTFTDEEWTKLKMKIYNRDAKDDSILISKYTLKECFEILGKPYPPD